ncbi:hypothetical protein FGE12_14725 [Aggregicoccus sp. 17bor-14]|uniref:hypothetical protein n=1 Tax=Myxococcaceae TaxID=31 RepID=UPI00129C8361|nr:MULTISPECIES: hypothetical protein [Myxococcaceae]MBF5043648.1 hypothetical protein [Simulacricoccus sp. 17bor-14]MRI89407.1 hypothetical protein [Aggregicoccus sp. 17bor-14]
MRPPLSPDLPTPELRLLRATALALALGAGGLALGCAGPDLGPSRGTRGGPWWIPDSEVRSAVGAVQETSSYREQRQAPHPVHFRAAGEREALLGRAVAVLRAQGFSLQPQLDAGPLRTVRRDGGLSYGTVSARPAVLARSYALALEPVPSAPGAAPALWACTLWVEVERCAREDARSPRDARPCAPQAEAPPELQRELDALGQALEAALREPSAPATAAAAR